MTDMEDRRVKRPSKTEQFILMDLPKIAVPIIVLLFISAVLFAGGCSSTPYVEVGMGHNTSLFAGTRDTEWDNAQALGATIEGGLEWEVPNNPNMTAKCRWLHVSQWTAGPPFNNRAESSLDHIGCSAKWRFK